MCLHRELIYFISLTLLSRQLIKDDHRRKGGGLNSYRERKLIALVCFVFFLGSSLFQSPLTLLERPVSDTLLYLTGSAFSQGRMSKVHNFINDKGRKLSS